MPDFRHSTDVFLADLDKLQASFIKRIEQMLAAGLSNADLATLQAEIDFFAELEALGFNNKVRQYFNNYSQIVLDVNAMATTAGVAGIVGTTAIDLQILAENEALFVLDKGRLYTQQFKTALFSSIIGGQPVGEILPTLGNIALTDTQLNTAINTGISRFQATAVGKVFEDEPETRFVLEGPLDNKTRDTCRRVLERQEPEGKTREEIDEGAWKALAEDDSYTFVNRGGFACRHFIGVV